jgi:hypothetical protein
MFPAGRSTFYMSTIPNGKAACKKMTLPVMGRWYVWVERRETVCHVIKKRFGPPSVVQPLESCTPSPFANWYIRIGRDLCLQPDNMALTQRHNLTYSRFRHYLPKRLRQFRVVRTFFCFQYNLSPFHISESGRIQLPLPGRSKPVILRQTSVCSQTYGPSNPLRRGNGGVLVWRTLPSIPHWHVTLIFYFPLVYSHNGADRHSSSKQ